MPSWGSVLQPFPRPVIVRNPWLSSFVFRILKGNHTVKVFIEISSQSSLSQLFVQRVKKITFLRLPQEKFETANIFFSWWKWVFDFLESLVVLQCMVCPWKFSSSFAVMLQGLPFVKSVCILCLSSFADFFQSKRTRFLAEGRLNKRSKKAL